MEKIFVIAGPPGWGESTITRAMIKRFPGFKRLITATTRQPRNNEKQGVDYYFFNKERFKKEIKAGRIIEHTYVKNRKVYYGSYKPDLDRKLKKGFNIIINPDLVGARFFKKNYHATTIFLKPDSLNSVKQRLIFRDGQIKTAELKRRLKNAKNEIKNESGFYDVVVINRQGRLAVAINEVAKIIKSRLSPRVDKTP